MPLLIAVLVFLLVGAILMAVELLRPAQTSAGSLDLETLRQDYGRPDPYGPMARLLSRDDDEYLRYRQVDCENLRCRLRKQRRKALKLYIRRIGDDYSVTWRLCKLLAPISEDQNFVVRLAASAVKFHCTRLAALAVVSFGAEGLVRERLSALAEMGTDLRETASTLLDSAAEWSPSAASAA